jgi:hypothetical protein
VETTFQNHILVREKVNLFANVSKFLGFLLLLLQKIISLALCSQTLMNFSQKTITRLLSLFLVSCTKFSALVSTFEIEQNKPKTSINGLTVPGTPLTSLLAAATRMEIPW